MQENKQKVPHDALPIDIEHSGEVEYWCHKLGVTSEKLRDIVQKVGNSPRLVRNEVSRNPFIRKVPSSVPLSSKVTLYENINYTGDQFSTSLDTPAIPGHMGINDGLASSIKIRPPDKGPEILVISLVSCQKCDAKSARLCERARLCRRIRWYEYSICSPDLRYHST